MTWQEKLIIFGVLLWSFMMIWAIMTDINWRELWFMLWPANDQELKRDIFKIWKLRAKNDWWKFKRDLKWELFDLWQDIKGLPAKTRRRVWNKHLLLTYHRLWIRKDEFDRSLNMDVEAVMEMNESERESYIMDLVHRRQIAHERDLAEQDSRLSPADRELLQKRLSELGLTDSTAE